MQPTLLVLAAGIGNRYGGLKQIDPVGPAGETFIDYSIFDAIRAGFGKVVFVIRRNIEDAFKEAVGRRFESKLAVDYAFQEIDELPPGIAAPAGRTKPWGTGHAILMGESKIREPFGVVNGDDFYGPTSFKVLAEYLKAVAAIADRLENAEEYCMVGFHLANTLSEHGAVSRGVCFAGPDGYLRGVTEHTEIVRQDIGRRFSGDEIVSMNMWGFLPSIFGHLRSEFIHFLADRGSDPKAEFFIPSVVNGLIANGKARVKVLRTPDPCFGVTYKEDRPSVVANIRRLSEKSVYPEPLWT